MGSTPSGCAQRQRIVSICDCGGASAKLKRRMALVWMHSRKAGLVDAGSDELLAIVHACASDEGAGLPSGRTCQSGKSFADLIAHKSCRVRQVFTRPPSWLETCSSRASQRLLAPCDSPATPRPSIYRRAALTIQDLLRDEWLPTPSGGRICENDQACLRSL